MMMLRWYWKVFCVVCWTPPDGLGFRVLFFPADRRLSVYLCDLDSNRTIIFRDQPNEPAGRFLARLDTFAIRFETGGPCAMPTAPIDAAAVVSTWFSKQQAN